ncbi:hypothetical protein MPH_00438 [Macrophomina phaseolina MS6]|uniref:Uncharacterized protein n=1 Tax=Macrophomina phaseolina (strain MS6) TaxID=1126212 RepID=K2SIE2_MACPH|nr:hypothetical protein MPH_00438 [Macrophomina phaseolina MS6]
MLFGRQHVVFGQEVGAKGKGMEQISWAGVHNCSFFFSIAFFCCSNSCCFFSRLRLRHGERCERCLVRANPYLPLFSIHLLSFSVCSTSALISLPAAWVASVRRSRTSKS